MSGELSVWTAAGVGTSGADVAGAAAVCVAEVECCEFKFLMHYPNAKIDETEHIFFFF